MAYASEVMPVRKRKALTARRVKLFKNGRSQAVRIPRDFTFAGTEVVMRKDGKRLTIESAPKQRLKKPARKKSLLAWLDSLPPPKPNDRLPEIDDLPAEPFDL